MTVTTFMHGATPNVVTWPNGGGYTSLRDMQRNLCKRFAHREPEKVPTGVRMKGDVGTTQLVEWIND